MNEYPRVLVISHNVFSRTSSMGKTMEAFFKGWDKNCLAQLFFHTEMPNSNICKNYFRVTDFDILKSIIKFSTPGVTLDMKDIKIDRASSRVDQGLKKDIYNWGKQRKPYMFMLRNLVWKTNIWKTKKLINWIDEYNPEVIFFAAGDYTFSMDVAIKINRYKNIPLIVFFGDDYYFVEAKKFSLIDRLNRKDFKSSFNKLFSSLSFFIAASDKMEKEYSKYFKKPGKAIMTSSQINECNNYEKNMQISYIGNLGLDRWEPLIKIGKLLKEMDFYIDVYSGESRNSVISHLTEENGIKFHGVISSNEVNEVIKNSKLLIHVESFDEEIKKKTRYSMSTKIAESLSSGVCLLAFGPSDVSSIEYLKSNRAACVVNDIKSLDTEIKKLLNDEGTRKEYIKNALLLASIRHDSIKNSALFKNLIETVIIEWRRSKNESITN